MSDAPAQFDLQTQLAHARQAAERLAEDLKIARLTIHNHQLREITLTEEVQRANETTRRIKEEAVNKAAEAVERLLLEDATALCGQLGIELQGEPKETASYRIAATMKMLGEDKVRLEWLTRFWDSQATGAQPIADQRYYDNPTGSVRDAIDAACKAA